MRNITLSFLNENTATSWLINDSDSAFTEWKKLVISPSFKEGPQCLIKVISPLLVKMNSISGCLSFFGHLQSEAI